ncbi:MAG: NAD(P)H-dependent oxidoreductase [Deltaproteobacteria bacterium]|jgi:flavodoxin|nr:NAD(P)H-dependent oxidoreductase [Deltaproteobacteria bacterium]
MTKQFIIILAVILSSMIFIYLPLLATSNSPTDQNTQETINNDKILIAFFSWDGHTKKIAETIDEKIEADLFEIKVVNPYSNDYSTTVETAQKELAEQARPELATHIATITEYKTIILGYPNWWGSIPMPVASFLEEYDFTGKTIIPFCSHEGGGFGQSLNAIAKLVPNAIIGEGLSIRSTGGFNLSNDISKWLNDNHLILIAN